MLTTDIISTWLFNSIREVHWPDQVTCDIQSSRC